MILPDFRRAIFWHEGGSDNAGNLYLFTISPPRYCLFGTEDRSEVHIDYKQVNNTECVVEDRSTMGKEGIVFGVRQHLPLVGCLQVPVNMSR